LTSRLLEDKKSQLSILRDEKNASEIESSRRITRLQTKLMKADQRLYALDKNKATVRNRKECELNKQMTAIVR